VFNELNVFNDAQGGIEVMRQAGKNLTFFLEEMIEALSLSSQKQLIVL
jgi:hypothetical protein